MTVPPLNEFIVFVLYEWPSADDVPFFCVCLCGPRRAFACRSVSNQSSGLRLDRDANDYRPGDDEPVGTPFNACCTAPRSPRNAALMRSSMSPEHAALRWRNRSPVRHELADQRSFSGKQHDAGPSQRVARLEQGSLASGGDASSGLRNARRSVFVN